MRVFQIFVLVTVCVLAGSVRPAAQTPPRARDLSQTEISVESRSPWCVGCPEWRVTFRGNGTAEFTCFGVCTVPGTQGESFPRVDFAALVNAVDEAGFFDLPRVVGGCTDCDVVTLTYRDERRIHEVVDEGFARLPKLEALETRLSLAMKIFEQYTTPSAANYQKLLDSGWDPNEPLGPSGETMLNYAVYSVEPDAVRLLLDRGARVNGRALESASRVSILAILWPAARMTPSSPEARTLLINASSGNWRDCVSWLLDKGVDVNAREPESGMTPLMGAARSAYRDSVSLLIDKGARVDLRDASGNQALWYAASTESSPSVIALLLARGLKVDDVNVDGRTPLMHAAESCSAVNVRELIAAGADPKRKDASGRIARDLVPPGRGYRIPRCQATRAAFGSSGPHDSEDAP